MASMLRGLLRRVWPARPCDLPPLGMAERAKLWREVDEILGRTPPPTPPVVPGRG